MKKLILQNTLIPQLLIYGGLALIMWPTMLRTLDILNFGNDVRPGFLYVGLGVIVGGVALRIYQEQQAGESFFKSYLFQVVLGIAVAAILMLMGLIKMPAFLQNLLHG